MHVGLPAIEAVLSRSLEARGEAQAADSTVPDWSLEKLVVTQDYGGESVEEMGPVDSRAPAGAPIAAGEPRDYTRRLATVAVAILMRPLVPIATAAPQGYTQVLRVMSMAEF